MPDDAELAAVRAFLDAFEAYEGFESSSPSSKDNANGPLDWRARGYSTLMLRRKRVEAQRLREQARELEARLSQLKQLASTSGDDFVIEAKTTRARLEAAAASELVARQLAEETNQQLRANLDGMMLLREEMARLIEDYLRQDRELGKLETPVMPSVPVGQEDPQHTLNAMINQVGSLFASIPLHPLNALASCSLTSSSLPNGFELRSTVAASCSASTAVWLLWGRPPREYPPPLVNAASADGSIYRREMVMPLRSRRHPEMDMYVQHFGRRVRDPVTGQVVLVMHALIRVPAISNEVLVSEQFWTKISPTNDLGSVGSITHACYQIRSVSPVTSSKALAVQDRVKHSLVMLTRQNNVVLQNWLLEASS